jgi:hypothetical protein
MTSQEPTTATTPGLSSKSKKPRLKFDYKQVEALAGQGLNREQIALCLGICKATLYNNQKRDEKFKEAIEVGRAKAIAHVTSELFRHIKLGSMTGIIFFLKCQAGWKETNIIETTDPLTKIVLESVDAVKRPDTNEDQTDF